MHPSVMLIKIVVNEHKNVGCKKCGANPYVSYDLDDNSLFER